MANSFSWKPSDVSTFYQQSQNLGQQAGTQGLQTGQQQAQQQTSQKQSQVGQTGQNIAQGAQQVAQGANAQPVIAYNPQTANQSQQTAPAQPNYTSGAPDLNVQNTSQLSIPVGNQGAQYTTPNFSAPNSVDLSALSGKTNQDNFANTYNQALGQINNQGNTDLNAYTTKLQKQLGTQQTAYDTQLSHEQTALSNIQNQKQQAINDYIGQLSNGLQNYQTGTSDLTNTGQLSAAEQQSANLNAALSAAGPNANTQTLAALTGGNLDTNSRLAVLGQQAQSGALQSAQEQAQVNQAQSDIAKQQLAAGQTAQQQGYANAAKNITGTQTDLTNQLATNVANTSQQLQQAHDKANQYLSQQEQTSVQNAANTLKNSNVTPARIQSAAKQWTGLVGNYADNNKNNPAVLQNLLKSYLQIWQASTKGQSIDFSHQISSTFQPTVDKINSYLTAYQNNVNKYSNFGVTL